MISNHSVPADAALGAEKPISSPALLAFSWLVVLIPLAWGVYNTVMTSTNLFISTAPAQAAPQTGAVH
jgi:hypothetical protein